MPVPDTTMAENYLDDARIAGYDPLMPPALLRHELPSSFISQKTISTSRQLSSQIIHGHDDRLLVVLGPCSIHDPEQALEYARKLKAEIDAGRWEGLAIVMRVYFEKPRTTVGWKGLINDPDIDNSFKINKGLRIARQLLCDITEMGVPIGSELLDTISPQFIADLICWGAIGARTTESQLHRELASGVSFPIGFKNGTDGSVGVAVDAMTSAEHPHNFMGVTSQGMAAIVKTAGNKDVHVILRGGSSGPNFSAEHVNAALDKIRKTRPNAFPSLMVDCSHGNSSKNHRNQPLVVDDICRQLEAGQRGITGVMFESNLNEGKQSVPDTLPEGVKDVREVLKRGVSITDACVDFETSLSMLDKLNAATLKRREVIKSQPKA